MIVSAESCSTKYRVEVSGWDERKAFFVENAELDWSEELGKSVTLTRGLAKGAVIFLRLLQPMSDVRTHPVPYEVEFVAHTEQGQSQFRLRPLGGRAMRDSDLFR